MLAEEGGITWKQEGGYCGPESQNTIAKATEGGMALVKYWSARLSLDLQQADTTIPSGTTR